MQARYCAACGCPLLNQAINFTVTVEPREQPAWYLRVDGDHYEVCEKCRDHALWVLTHRGWQEKGKLREVR